MDRIQMNFDFGNTFIQSNNNLDFSRDPQLEGIRQWLVLVLSLVIICLCWRASYSLYKTRGVFTFDCLVIFCESIRVLVLLMYEFVWDHLVMLMGVFLVQSILRAVICANFTERALLLKNRDPDLVRRFQIGYYVIIGTVLLALVALSIFTDYAVSCQNDFFSFHWFVIDVIDLG